MGLIVGAVSHQTSYCIQPDALGTPRVIIDPDRDVAVWRWELQGEAFGNDAPMQDPDNDGIAFVFDLRFPGQRFDAATGMNYNYFRDYDAATGRYSQSDPIGLGGGISTYLYALGSPAIHQDIFGLKVLRCRRPTGLPWPLSLTYHYCLVTDRYESGVGPADGGVLASNSQYDKPGALVQTNDHHRQAAADDSVCEEVPDMGEECVNNWIAPGRELGEFGPTNNCQTFASTVINSCRFGSSPSQSTMQPCLIKCHNAFGSSNLCNLLCN